MFSRAFQIDPRSLGLFRILLGMVLVWDLCQKLIWADAFFSDQGVFPRAYWIEHFMGSEKVSFHLASGLAGFQTALIAFQILAAFLFLVGWKPQIWGFISLVLLCSLQSRNNQILSASDDLIRLALVWSLLCPIDLRFGVSSSPVPEPARPLASVATAGLKLQLLLIYVVSVFFKQHPVWLEEKSAIYYALNIDMFAKPLAVWLRDQFGLTQILTLMTLILEGLIPFLALAGGWLALGSAAVFIGFHLSLFMVFELGSFPWMAMAYWTVFFPAQFWGLGPGRWLESRLEIGSDRLRSGLAVIGGVSRELFARREPVKQGAASVILLLVFAANLQSLNLSWFQMPEKASRIVSGAYLNQTWNMFAPYPIRNDGWYVVSGQFEDGSESDLLTKKPVSYEKPFLPADAYANSDWRKFMLNVWDHGNQKYLLPFSRYLCRQWNSGEQAGRSLRTFKVEFMKETTPSPGVDFEPASSVLLWSHDCFSL
jgi:hypothetical protein